MKIKARTEPQPSAEFQAFRADLRRQESKTKAALNKLAGTLTIPISAEDLAAAKTEAERLHIPLQSLLCVVADHLAAHPEQCKGKEFRAHENGARIGVSLPPGMRECLKDIARAAEVTSTSNAVRLVVAEAGRRTR